MFATVLTISVPQRPIIKGLISKPGTLGKRQKLQKLDLAGWF